MSFAVFRRFSTMPCPDAVLGGLLLLAVASSAQAATTP